MKYLYVIIYSLLLKGHCLMISIMWPMKKAYFRIAKVSEDAQVAWIKQFNKGYLEFPGGIIDWWVFAVFSGFIYGPLSFFVLKFDVAFFESGLFFWLLFFCTIGWSYYYVYVLNIEWLKSKIIPKTKKYYLKLEEK